MTQNTSYASSLSDRDADQNGRTTPNAERNGRTDSSDDPQEIKAEIDQTRQAVGAKIDQLQARLDPNRLKQQAQETVQEILSDTANQMSDYVRSHKDDITTSIADAARRNPLPAALVGVGIGWLILESFAGGSKSRSHGDSWEEDRRRYFEREARRGPQSRGRYADRRGSFVDDEYLNDEYASYSNPSYAGVSSAGYNEFSSARNYDQGRGYQQGRGFDQGYQQRWSDEQERGSGRMASATGAVKETVGDVKERVEDVKERVGDMTHEAKERVGEIGHEIKERVSNMTQDVKERVGGVTDRASETAGGVRHQASELTDQAKYELQRTGYRAQEWRDRARYEGQRRGQQVIRNLEDNPLTYGLVALAAGAALAILLPQTRTENRAFGEMRDQVMEKGQEALESAKAHAQNVAEELRPELEDTARKLVSDVKEAGKEVAQTAQSELRPVVEKAVSKTKEEARSAAQEAGIDPDKLTGNGSPKAGTSTAETSTGTSNTGTSNTGTSSSGASNTSATMSNKPASGSSTSGSATMSSTSTTSGTSTTAAGQSKTGGMAVNRDILKGQWNQIKGEMKKKWGQLTDDDITKIEGDYDKFVGSLQTRYGYARARAEQEANEFLSSRKA
jgi:uncharacterized protein YjbJ (UPF0337 family)